MAQAKLPQGHEAPYEATHTSRGDLAAVVEREGSQAHEPVDGLQPRVRDVVDISHVQVFQRIELGHEEERLV